jgi:hypothetical protein
MRNTRPASGISNYYFIAFVSRSFGSSGCPNLGGNTGNSRAKRGGPALASPKYMFLFDNLKLVMDFWKKLALRKEAINPRTETTRFLITHLGV